jgi:NAD(P)H-flavin reductase
MKLQYVHMPDLFPAKVIDRTPQAESQVMLILDIPREIWTRHTMPAQYIDIFLPEIKPWRGTIASRPGQEFFEMLIKDVGDRSARVASLAPGNEIQISLPAGSGFPVLEYRKHNIILGASGVAVCAMRAVIQEILLARGDWKRVMLYYGERHSDRFALGEERERWREANIEVYLSASKPSDGTYWRGHTGYVQDFLLANSPDISETVAFVAGKDRMVEEFSTALMRLGLPQNLIFLNT